MSGPNLPPMVGTAEHRAMLGGLRQGVIGIAPAQPSVAGEAGAGGGSTKAKPRNAVQDAKLTNAEFQRMKEMGPRRCTHKIGAELIVNAPDYAA